MYNTNKSPNCLIAPIGQTIAIDGLGFFIIVIAVVVPFSKRAPSNIWFIVIQSATKIEIERDEKKNRHRQQHSTRIELVLPQSITHIIFIYPRY